MESGETSVYGASLAGGSFDFVKFIKQPQTILRVLSWVFSIVVFATITAEGYVNPPNHSQVVCVFNKNDGACHYGVGIGIIGFLACVGFLMVDIYLPMMSNAQERKRVVTADLVFSAAWTFLWFVCFCVLANQWANTVDVNGIPTDAVHAIIAFSFFSIATWGALTYLALMRFRQGVGEVSQNYGESAPDQTSQYPTSYVPPDHNSTYPATTYPATTYPASAYPSFPPGRPDIYQQPPFVTKQEPMGDSDYQPPAY
ncbi:synaptogyrin-2b [Astyanax mexicanus]|uniref:synaptogyrin-2b n=1 Tax=Astyanax mexicanus TaxID=7994 RepID=UPI0020CB61EF|nr:synaptogyrin-2b [Astyanax mexicanus]